MKKKWIIITLTLVFVFTLIPVSYLSARTNLLSNWDFSSSDLSSGDGSWDYTYDPGGRGYSEIPGGINGVAEVISQNDDVYLFQRVFNVSCKDLQLCFDVKRTDAGSSSPIMVGFYLFKDNDYKGVVWKNYFDASTNFPVGTWVRDNCLTLNKLWEDTKPSTIPLPDFDTVEISFMVDNGGIALFDNVRLQCPSSTAKEEEMEEPIWERGDQQMVCYQVWINDDGCFEFVFWYEYANNNHVMIYDKDGNEVFAIDMPYGDAYFTACLPDGMYTVKTFHDQPEPLQEFMIGKP